MSQDMDRVVRRPLWRSRRATIALGAAVAVVLGLVTLLLFVTPARRRPAGW